MHVRALGPQASHRDLRADDLVHGIDRSISSPRSRGRARVARAPSLETVFEERKMRTRRFELNDPAPSSTLRFSATYCPRVLTSGHFPGMPFVVQEEHLENFAILAKWQKFYINVTRTFSHDRVQGVRDYALPLFREAFARGQLR